jgi:hypothetical protein
MRRTFAALVLTLGILAPSKAISQPPPRTDQQHVLTDAEVNAAIQRGSTERNPKTIGLTLLDVQTALLTGMTCTTCGQSGYSIVIYTPIKWVEFKAAMARRMLEPFSIADVDATMRAPVLRVLAFPSRADYINGTGLSLSSSVSRVVLADHNKAAIIQPIQSIQGTEESNSALRSFTYTNAAAKFNLSDVDKIRGEDDKGEFFVVVVGTNQNKYFKVKTRMFKALF